jgi:hypothetical protein
MLSTEVSVVLFVLSMPMTAGMWELFLKADRPGWPAAVPFVNAWVMVQVTENRPWLFVLLLLSPVTVAAMQVTGAGWLWYLLVVVVPPNVAAYAKLLIDLAQRFGRGVWSGLGLVVLPFVFFPLLGYGDAQYQSKRPDGASVPGAEG